MDYPNSSYSQNGQILEKLGLYLSFADYLVSISQETWYTQCTITLDADSILKSPEISRCDTYAYVSNLSILIYWVFGPGLQGLTGAFINFQLNLENNVSVNLSKLGKRMRILLSLWLFDFQLMINGQGLADMRSTRCMEPLATFSFAYLVQSDTYAYVSAVPKCNSALTVVSLVMSRSQCSVYPST